MAKQKFELNISEFDLDKVGVNLTVGEPDEGRGSESSLKMTATQLSVLAKALGAKKSDVQIITGLAGGEKFEAPEDTDAESDTPVCADNERPVEDDEAVEEDAAVEEAVDPDHADDDDSAEESSADDIADDEDLVVAESADDEPVDIPEDDDEGRDRGYDDDDHGPEYDDEEYPEEDYAGDIEAEEEFAAAAGYKGDRNSDIFDDPDIDLTDLQDLEERYLAARLRDGEGPAPSTSGLLGGLRQSLESALNMGNDSDEPRPKVRRGSKNPLVRDLIRRHIRNRGWE